MTNEGRLGYKRTFYKLLGIGMLSWVTPAIAGVWTAIGRMIALLPSTSFCNQPHVLLPSWGMNINGTTGFLNNSMFGGPPVRFG